MAQLRGQGRAHPQDRPAEQTASPVAMAHSMLAVKASSRLASTSGRVPILSPSRAEVGTQPAATTLGAARAQAAWPGPADVEIALTTGPGRNRAALWKPLIDAFGPVPGEDPLRPLHPRDDRIVSLGLHHYVTGGIGHDLIINAWWASQ